MTEVTPAHIQYTVATCKQITFLILYLVSFRLVSFLSWFVCPCKSPIFIFLLSVSNSLILLCRISCFLFMKCLPVFHPTLFTSSPIMWLITQLLKCSLLLESKVLNILHQIKVNVGSVHNNTRLSLTGILTSLIFSPVTSLTLLPTKYSKAAALFEILT